MAFPLDSSKKVPGVRVASKGMRTKEPLISCMAEVLCGRLYPACTSEEE